MKKVKGGRFWIRVVPDHPMSAKPVGVRMGKGKGAFDHFEAKVPVGKILFEIGGGVREEVAREAFRIVNTKLACQTEFVLGSKDETIQQACDRIAEFCRVPPLGVFAISYKTNAGMEELLKSLATFTKLRYLQ